RIATSRPRPVRITPTSFMFSNTIPPPNDSTVRIARWRCATCSTTMHASPASSSANPTISVRCDRRSGSRRCRHATNHSKPGLNTGASIVPLRSPSCRSSRAVGAHEGEEDHVADGRLVGEEHDQAIDADAFAGGGREAVFEGAAIVIVVLHRFFGAFGLRLD